MEKRYVSIHLNAIFADRYLDLYESYGKDKTSFIITKDVLFIGETFSLFQSKPDFFCFF